MTKKLSTQELLEKWIKIINSDKPHASIRIGDGEAVVLAHGEIINMDFINKFYDWVKNKEILYCGTVLPNHRIRRKLIEAYYQADFIGVLNQTRSWKFKPITDMVVEYYGFNPQYTFYAFDNYFLSTNKNFYEFLKDKSILLVGSKSKAFKDILQKRYDFSNIVGYVNCKNSDYIEKAKQKMDRYKYRVALVSAGVPGKILTAYAKSKGNVGIDFGSGVDTVLEADAQNLYAWEFKTVPKRDFIPPDFD